MSIHWSLKHVPELASLTRKQRDQVHEQCLRRYFFRAPATTRSGSAYLSAILIASTFAALGAGIPSWLGMTHGFWVIPTGAMMGAMMGSTIGRHVLSRIAMPTLRPYYREFIE
jgi:hypothetical protein